MTGLHEGYTWRVLEDEGNDRLAVARELVAERLLVPSVAVGRPRCHKADEHKGEQERRRGQRGSNSIFGGEVRKDRQRVEGGECKGEPFEPCCGRVRSEVSSGRVSVGLGLTEGMK